MMETNRLFTGIFKLCRWITYFFWLNLLWVGGTLLGGIVFGVMPSTTAVFTIARKTAAGEEDVPLFRTYWSIYRESFVRSNGVGALLLIISLIWYVDFMFFRNMEGALHSALHIVLIAVGIAIGMLLLYVFPVMVHYQVSIMATLKKALFIGFLLPANTVFLFVSLLSIYYLLIYLPGLIPLVGVSFIIHVNMWIAYKGFERLTEIHLKHQKKNASSERLPTT
ncbi:YesL family protein [Alkalicoccobacillus murimartini]|uniref:Membrane protein YesL n=1 Tax=Alkalicoccobacillus murimartini TaxID=171685 RepID=A0ABT9YJZ9_9BACI|nr:YesL family protein [Alkalicoccobacillus murimartini]MDQ0208190.1 putative membrane protein YesL [Alkalicoccobacillus murimartini]